MNDSPLDFGEKLRPFLPQDGAPVAVAVSGGPDSMALCHALAHSGNSPVHALTVDHGLRPESAQEARDVGAWLESWPRIAHQVLTRTPGQKPQARIQEDARHDRYRLLADYCAAHHIDRLFTAHHLGDQAETFLFRLAKGSGLDGLGGMRAVHAYSPALQIIRPLLDVPKAALIAYCRDHHITCVQDPSNEDSRFARARLRRSAEILAEEGLTPKRLATTAARLARAREALDSIAGREAARALISKDSERIVFDFAAVRELPAEIRLRIVLAAMAQLGGGGGYGPRLEKAEGLVESVFNNPGFKRASLAGCLIGLEGKKPLLVVEKEPQGA